MKFRIFVSSVQSEFSKERAMLARYIREDALLGDFFDVFLFEEQPARNCSAQAVYLDEVASCDIYLGLFGSRYGSRDAEGVSPTEREYDCATSLHKTRLAFVKTVARRERREEAFVSGKADAELCRNAFSDFEQLRSDVYKTLVNFLKEGDQISTKAFDESFSRHVTMDALDESKFKDYLRLVTEAGKVTFPKNVSNADILVRIGLMDKATRKIANGAIPLFAKNPEETNPAWEIRCIQFYGTRVVKPVPSLHTYNGTVFELVDQAVDFVMGRVDFAVGSHNGENAAAPTKAEFPREAIREAIVNAVCHRDYTSNACVQVMLFRDRLEIINPGSLPKGMTVEDLYRTHDSIPRNRLIARAMSWTSYVEKSGSGTGEILDLCTGHGLARPEFDPTVGFFKTIVWRNGYAGPSRGTQSRDPVAGEVAGAKSSGPKSNGPKSVGLSRGPKSHYNELSVQIRVVEALCRADLKSSELAIAIGQRSLSGRLKERIVQMMEDGVIEYTIPSKPRSRLQRYHLTAKGVALAQTLAKKR